MCPAHPSKQFLTGMKSHQQSCSWETVGYSDLLQGEDLHLRPEEGQSTLTKTLAKTNLFFTRLGQRRSPQWLACVHVYDAVCTVYKKTSVYGSYAFILSLIYTSGERAQLVHYVPPRQVVACVGFGSNHEEMESFATEGAWHCAKHIDTSINGQH